MEYSDFIDRKRRKAEPVGFDVGDQLHPALYPFQSHIVRWALRMGRVALFEDCGLGKTVQQLEWAIHVTRRTTKPVLILTPLAVGKQTVREAEKLDIDDISTVRKQDDVQTSIAVTNYEMLRHFDPTEFGGIVLDESSILKQHLGSMRTEIIEFANIIPYRMAATATPAPNDIVEIANHAHYLGVMTVAECRALFFIQDEGAQSWRLKGHARQDFWRWVGTWAVAVRKPSDMGYDDGEFDLPPLVEHQHMVDAKLDDGSLFGRTEAVTLNEQRQIRRESLPDRVAICADLANKTTEPWIIWCDLNDESTALKKAIPGSVEVRGQRQSGSQRTASMIGFSDGRFRVMITKPSIAGHGMNWQHCANVAFCGLGHSYEMYYQAIRRSWRFGQIRPVNVHIVASSADTRILDNVKRKERDAMDLYDSIIHHMMPDTRMEMATETGTRGQEMDGPFISGIRSTR